MPQNVYIPIPAIGDSTTSANKCLAAWQYPSSGGGWITELSLTVIGALSTDTILNNYFIARVASLGTTPAQSFNAFQMNRSLSNPATVAAAIGPFATDPVPVTTSGVMEVPWSASVASTREVMRAWNPGDLPFKESEFYGLFVNINSSTNSNMKFNGYIYLVV